jgi:Porphobilinogen deaminase
LVCILKRLERYFLINEADLAVHSLKDLPIEDQKDTLNVFYV